MTNHEKVKWLKQYKYLDNHINRMLEEKERYKSVALKITPTWSDMPKGGDGENPRELAICKMMDCEKEIEKMIDEYADLGNDIRGKINDIDNLELRLLLNYRYIDGLTWELISVKMGFTFQWVHILHSRALGEIKI